MMEKSRTNPKVDFYFTKAEKWRVELEILRTIVLNCGLAEELKWGVPCYTFQDGNVVLLHAFKEYCALLFPKGALLKDSDGILIQQTENTQAARQIRFTSVQGIAGLEAVLKTYIQQAIEIEKAGLKVNFKDASAFQVPEAFQQKLDETPSLNTAFKSLTPGRQRAYLLHFAAPKQTQTRVARVEKCTPQILMGKGLNE